jgi:DNA-binding MarR family transcriptional regulator
MSRPTRSRRAGAATGDQPLPDVLAFMQLLWALVHRTESLSKQMGTRLGVTGLQRLVLRMAGLYPGLSAGALSSLLHVHPSTLTGVLQRLVDQGWLERVDDARDRRRAVLKLTAAGARINRRRTGTVEAAVSRALDGIPAADRAATRRVLERLTAHLAPASRE